MKILLAVDGSDYTRKMLDYVCANKSLFDPAHHYTLLNTQAPLPPHARASLSGELVKDYYQDESRKVLDVAAAALSAKGITAELATKVGPAGETIASFAEQGQYEMIIMGSHGHGAMARLMLGSVSSEVLAHCGVPVLLVR